jgi:NAD(P)-dependent dehydrogenase (short-subunit alcohol dehydrogenase family)
MTERVVPFAIANGKAWLATMPVDRAIRIALDAGPGTRPGLPRAVATVAALVGELEQTRRRGHGYAEAEEGVAAIAVTVGEQDDAPGADLALTVDVTDDEALSKAAQYTVEQAGPIAALVVNAGILGPVVPVRQATPAEIRRVLDVNLTSAFLTIRAVVPHMRRNPAPDRGRIVFMSSVQAKEGTALSGPYAASKAGLIALAKCLAKELAGKAFWSTP